MIRRGHDSGWVLMEALVSMVVLSVAVVALNRGFGEAVLTRAIARDYTQARFFLEQVAGELELRPLLQEGASGSGDFGEEHPRFSYTWAVTKRELSTPEIPVALSPRMQNVLSNFEPPIQYLGELQVTVNWTRAGASYSAALETTFAPGRLVVMEEDAVVPPI